MTTDERLNLITQFAEEILTLEDLRTYIEQNVHLKHYIGFEISGKLHIGSGIQTMKVVKNLQEAGVETSIFLADWHTWINNKLGGDMEVIQNLGVEYFKEGFKACMKAVGGNPDSLNFVLGTELYRKNPDYWSVMIDVAKNTTLSRMKRSITIAGRREEGDINFATLIYPAMQVADIFTQGITIAHAGTDQRKAHVIARDVANAMQVKPLLDSSGNKIKPVALHHHLVLGLATPSAWPVAKDQIGEMLSDMKMSKSKPDSAVFITDEPDEIHRKIKGAFCPEGETGFNPVLDWTKHFVFFQNDSKLEIKREAKHGGNVTYTNYEDVEKDFAAKSLHPLDLKNAAAEEIVKLLKPVRDHFSSGKPAELKEQMEKIVITR